jgi:hypothetical protein
MSANAQLRTLAEPLQLVRMIDLAGYTFPENRASIVCTHVWDGDPVLLFVHDSDGDIQFYCGEHSHSMSDALVLGLAEIRGHLQAMQDIPTVDPGNCAERSRSGGAWTIRQMND